MRLDKYFDKIYCINLDRRKDRWEETEKELKKWGLIDQVERYSAVDGNKINNNPYNVNNGELGLIETHLSIIKDSKKNGYKNILLLEDDIEFTEEINKVESYFSSLPENWDILWFGGNHNKHMGNKINLINDKIIKCNQTYSTHCIGFNESIYDLVINLLEKRQKPVDVYYSDIQKGYECYSFNPSVALQRASYSDFQNREQDNKWLF
jgi:GR25 family glycosyltransferase involved in LPS biosynthesis